MKTVFLCVALTVIIGFSMVVASNGHGRSGSYPVNPFRFDDVTLFVETYVYEKTKQMFTNCDIDYKKMPTLFSCLKAKYDANKDAKSKDPKKSFIGMLQLMESYAVCFKGVSATQERCILATQKVMAKAIDDTWIYFGKLMDNILKSCHAPAPMVSCVNAKKNNLAVLFKTVMNNPVEGHKISTLGGTLQSCLTSNETVEKCVLIAPGERWSALLQHAMKVASMKLLADCKVTPQNTPDVFLCLSKQYKEINFESVQDPKQKFMGAMRLIHTSAVCYENVTVEQKLCLSEKKKEVQEMISQKMKVFDTVIDEVLKSCGVDKSKTPEIVQCIAPKRSELEKMIPELINNEDIAEPVWNLMEEMKSCFDSKPESLECIKRKGKHFRSKFGAEAKGLSKSEIIRRLKMMLPNCNISKTTNKDLYECLKPLEMILTSVISKTDMNMTTKLKELQKMHISGAGCMVHSNNETTQCLAKQGAPLKDVIIQLFQKRPSNFDPKTAMSSMNAKLRGCKITKEKTPELMVCLDERTKAVMELKPWLPMNDEVREKLRAEGKKYWKCFQEKNSQEKACMVKMIEGFKKLGKKKAAARTKVASISSNKNIQDMINATVSKVLSCSKNKCFHKRVEKGVALFKAYLKQIEMKFNEEAMSNATESLRKNISTEVVGAMFCLLNDNTSNTQEIFSCFKNVLNETMHMVKRIAKTMGIRNDKKEENVNQRKKREADDDDNTISLLILTFLSGDKDTDDDSSTITVFQLLFNDESMEQVQSLIMLMRTFISTCTSWAPPPEEMRRRDLFENSKPVTMVESKSEQCRRMYDEINFFIDTGEFKRVPEPKDHDDDKKSSAMITAATVGSIIAVIAGLFSVFVAIIVRRRCGKCCNSSHAPPPSAPPHACPSPYTSFPSNMPPSYNECLDTGKYHPSSSGLSQILATSTKGDTEKSC